jgi:hypothetical protein
MGRRGDAGRTGRGTRRSERADDSQQLESEMTSPFDNTPNRPARRCFLLSVPAALLLGSAAAAQGLPPVQHEFADGGVIRFYGQINKGILSYDDGRETESYGLIDNDNSGTRAGISYARDFGAWAFENVNEIAYTTYSSSNANVLNTSPNSDDYEFTNANIRKIDFTFAHERYGKFWLGQGSMATDGIQEIDLSGTDVIAYSSVADSAGGQIIRFSEAGLDFDESLSGITIGDAFTNYDGPRRVRLRYDTPDFNGFTAAAAFGRDLLSDDEDTREENIFDASLTYARTYGSVDVEAGLGYYWQEDDSTNWGGSASGLHTPTGLNLTLGFGTVSPEEGSDGSFWYSKLGLLRDYVSWGSTALSVDYYSGDDFFLDEDAGITSSSSDSWGLALVQTIERANTDLWLTWRNYDYSDNVASYEDGQAIFGGARFRF